MKTKTVDEFKIHFSEVIEHVKKGEEIAVTYGKKKEIIGYFKPEVRAIKRERSFRLFDKMEGYFMADNFYETNEDDFPINDLPLHVDYTASFWKLKSLQHKDSFYKILI